MTEQNTNTEELDEAQKAELAEQERQARMWAKLQLEEAEKIKVADGWKNLGNMSKGAARDFVKKTCGFDPGF
jgi:hypothetical protein